jgi:hypothetical protein
MLTRRNIFDLKTLDSSFDDDLLSFKQNRVLYEQSININYINALSGAIDTSIKNYSSLYLTRASLDEDIFELSDTRLTPPVIFTQLNVIPTFLGSYPVSLFFKFDTEPQFLPPVPQDIYSCSFVTAEQIVNKSDTIFELELLPESLCRIKHVYNGYPYYLHYDSDDTISTYLTACSSTPIRFYFRGGPNIDIDTYDKASNTIINQADNGLLYSSSHQVFNYILKDNRVVLFKATDESILTNSPFGLSGGVVSVSGPTIPSLTIVPVVSSFNYTDFNFIYINDTSIEPKLKLNSSWVTYDDTNVTTGKIDENNSKFNIPNQNLLNFQYNSIDEKLHVNVLKLKNHLSDKNYTKQQTYTRGIVRPNNQFTINQVVTSAPTIYTVLETEDLTLTDTAPCFFDIDSTSLLTEDLSSIAP